MKWIFWAALASVPARADIVPFPKLPQTERKVVSSCQTKLSFRFLNERMNQLALAAGVSEAAALRLSRRLLDIKNHESLARLVLLVHSNISKSKKISDEELVLMIKSYIQEDLEKLSSHNFTHTQHSQEFLSDYFDVIKTNQKNGEHLFLLFADRKAAFEDNLHDSYLDLKLNHIFISAEVADRPTVRREFLKLNHELVRGYDTYWISIQNRNRYQHRVKLAYKIVFVWNQLGLLNDIVDMYLGDGDNQIKKNEQLLERLVNQLINSNDESSSIDQVLTTAINLFFDDFVRIHQVVWNEFEPTEDVLTYMKRTFEKIESHSQDWLRMDNK